jgi:hypothetical protein
MKRHTKRTHHVSLAMGHDFPSPNLTDFLRKHGRISKAALERSPESSTKLRESVSTEYFYNYAVFANEFSVHSFQAKKKWLVVSLDPNKFAENVFKSGSAIP